MKKDHRNEFRGSKNGWREVWVGLEWPENEENRRPTMAATAAFAGLIWARPAAVRLDSWRQGHLTLLFLPGRHVCKVGGRNRLPQLKPDWPENSSKRPNSGPRVLGNVSRVLKLKMSVLGLGFYLARKTRFI